MELLPLIGNYIIIIGLMLLPIYFAKQLVPGPYRFVQRWLRRLGDFAMVNQAKRRGWTFAIFVHFALLAGIAILFAGIVTGTFGAVFAGVVYIAVAVTFAVMYRQIRRLRRGRRMLPGRRR